MQLLQKNSLKTRMNKIKAKESQTRENRKLVEDLRSQSLLKKRKKTRFFEEFLVYLDGLVQKLQIASFAVSVDAEFEVSGEVRKAIEVFGSYLFELDWISRSWNMPARVFIQNVQRLNFPMQASRQARFINYINWDFQYKCFFEMKFLRQCLSLAKKVVVQSELHQEPQQCMVWYKRQGDVMQMLGDYRRAKLSFCRGLQYCWFLQEEIEKSKKK
jgi:hypothetical protein